MESMTSSPTHHQQDCPKVKQDTRSGYFAVAVVQSYTRTRLEENFYLLDSTLSAAEIQMMNRQNFHCLNRDFQYSSNMWFTVLALVSFQYLLFDQFDMSVGGICRSVCPSKISHHTRDHLRYAYLLQGK
ncbi:hypothetical protein KC19_VG082400 [Ceratodon purpureus]|uniref:Uncharacterized protein n=1 Tax=Ceratodon purpureus TaxID=3225 RepID=A0A8T0HN99_CERPU|nr:hypothetical protein KC19_VG082400 [Ceratodon purpureus]